MDIFDLDDALIRDYARFARSFTEIRAADIRAEVERLYDSGRFWPDPLISINPHFEPGPTIDELVADGTIARETGQIFRIGGQGLRLHRHQGQAIAKASAGHSFVVTTGTGSGKSLCFFIPIVDRAIRARLAGEAPRTRAIIVYPMNALANSQMQELEKYLEQSGLPETVRPTIARYTGQESREERESVRKSRPDVILTNFMMLELLMTRQEELDREVISAAEGLEFLVLDELHTYRGRQGADVAMLVRRVKDRLCPDRAPICIGTSATMVSEADDKKAAVAQVAARLFGAGIGPDAIIDESLRRATADRLKVADLGPRLTAAVDEELKEGLSDTELVHHALAVWIELEMGLKDGRRLERHPPVTLSAAAERLAAAAGRESGRCRSQLQAMLIEMSRPAKERGGGGEGAFMAFKLHRFISGAGFVYSTLRPPGLRSVTLEGQAYDPTDEAARLYAMHFCRNCGQEYHPVTLTEVNGPRQALPRSIDDVPLEDEDDEQAGYLMPIPEDDTDFSFAGEPEDYPEEWTQSGPTGPRLKPAHRKHVPILMSVDPGGLVGAGVRQFWFLPGKFRFCLRCKDQPSSQAREITKLAGLSGEGRSSATTLLVSSALRWMNDTGSLDPEKRKLLAFTDNRQDAALQAGHFNDTLFVSLLRAAILLAVRRAGEAGLGEDQFGTAVQSALGFVLANKKRCRDWMLRPEAIGVAQHDAVRTLARVLAYRVWVDQRRGWRYTNPNLEETGLVRADYLSLDELAGNDELFSNSPQVLRSAPAEVRRAAMRTLLDVLRGGLAVATEALEVGIMESLGPSARQHLREPWAIGQQEVPRVAGYLMLEPPQRQDTKARDETLIIRGGHRSALGKALVKSSLWGHRLTAVEYEQVLKALLDGAERYGLVQKTHSPFGVDGWQLTASAVRLAEAKGRADGRRRNPYFVELYETLADALASGGGALFGLEGREHTAQVEADRREWREWRFRFGQDDQERIAANRDDLRAAGEPDAFLPVLFCSPTMELGVDISALNAVYLRNVPPTPANYAQRSGRAGRSGQAALIVSYCAAQSPHDRYYFERPQDMVRGVVRPPALDLANRDLVEAHLHAVWLAEAGQPLSGNIPEIPEFTQDKIPVAETIASALSADGLERRAATSMLRVLDSISDELDPAIAPWAADHAALANETAAQAFSRFFAAFERWRTLYRGAREQLKEAHERSSRTGLSASERRQAGALYAQANEQIGLLEGGGQSGGSDFYSYRYLATEGFLPGYNFPRLPLYAFVPASSYQGAKGAFLQRARFLAISEFGPGSLIYHEGRAYRVHRARLAAGLRDPANGLLATTNLFICSTCGAAHEHEPERCHACGATMANAQPIRNVLRIDNVETRPQERITANDEERQRRGFEIQTMFQWPERGDTGYDVRTTLAADREGPLLTLDYAASAVISRVNKGLRRRAEKSILGFNIETATGRWVGEDAAGSDDPAPDASITQRVVPIVRDRKNAALIRMAEASLSEQGMATLQHALTRGIDIIFQLEESELLTEATPSREDRKAILAYEATEGGAGVLNRLLGEPDALGRVARTALELMHYADIDRAVESGNPDDLVDEGQATCVKGCYRCLLSYFNQPDHELIDRTDKDALRLLLRVARSEVHPRARANSSGDSWVVALAKWQMPPPDAEPLTLAGTTVSYAWRQHLLVAMKEAPPAEVRAALEAAGYAIIVLPQEPGDHPPTDLGEMLGETVQ